MLKPEIFVQLLGLRVSERGSRAEDNSLFRERKGLTQFFNLWVEKLNLHQLLSFSDETMTTRAKVIHKYQKNFLA
jgi:hypothetical protein